MVQVQSTPGTPPATAPLRAAIYIRVSSPGQEDGYSLDTQLSECQAYAAEHGYSLDDRYVYREVHVGYELWERPQLTALREAVRRHEFDRIIVHTIERFSREPVHLGLLITEAKHDGVDIEFVKEDLDDSPEGALIRFVKGYAGKVESERIKERINRGQRARVEAGKLKGGHKPRYGYRFNEDRSRYLEDPDTADVVRRIFAENAQGSTLRAIAAGLDADGIAPPQRAAHWQATTIRRLLLHEGYTGVVTAYRQRFDHETKKLVDRPPSEHVTLPEGTAPALVTRETFLAVKDRLSRNQQEASRHNGDPTATLLRAGFVRCANCGGTMVAKNHHKGHRYVCHGRETDCSAPTSIAASIIDPAVLARMVQVASHPELIAAKLTDLQEHDPSADDLATIDRQLADVKRRQQNGIRALLNLDDESAALLQEQLAMLAERRRSLEAERGAVEARRRGWEEAQERLQDIEAWCRVVANRLEHADYGIKRDALIAFDVQVTVHKAGSTPRYIITMDPLITPPIVEPTSGSTSHNHRGFRITLRWTDADPMPASAGGMERSAC